MVPVGQTLCSFAADVPVTITQNPADPLRSPTILVAEDSNFNLPVNLSNRGDDSYNTSLTLSYPVGLSFSRLTLIEVRPSRSSRSAEEPHCLLLLVEHSVRAGGSSFEGFGRRQPAVPAENPTEKVLVPL